MPVRLATCSIVHAFLGCALVAGGATNVIAQTAIPIRELSAPDAKASDHFRVILGLRPLPNGKLLIDDGGRRQLSVVDERLANRTIVLDSVSSGGQSYGPRAAPLVRYVGDSTLLPETTSSSLLVIAPDGRPVRTASAPKAGDVYYMVSSASGVDASGRLVYRGIEPMINDRMRNMKGSIPPPDSAPIIRASFETRSVDTVARVKLNPSSRVDVSTVNNHSVFTTYINPLVSVDEWAILTDGTIAIVRGQDYHVDLVRANGTTLTGPKLAFDWKRLSDIDRQMLIDSTHKANEKRDSTLRAATRSGSARQIAMAGGTVSAASLAAERNGVKIDNPNEYVTTEVPPGELADYWPPIRTGAALADADSNLWVLPTTSAQSKRGELVYDVVNNNGIMMYRVRIPLGKSIAGFGRNGVVYLMAKDVEGWTLERTKVLAK